MQDAFMDGLKEAQGGFPKAVKFEQPGAMVVGHITAYDNVDGEYGPQVVVTLLLEDGTEGALYLSNAVLKSAFARLNPMVGERIGVKYVGEAQSATGRSYKNFVCKVDRAAGEGTGSYNTAAGIPAPTPEPAPEGGVMGGSAPQPETPSTPTEVAQEAVKKAEADADTRLPF